MTGTPRPWSEKALLAMGTVAMLLALVVLGVLAHAGLLEPLHGIGTGRFRHP